MKTTVKPGKVTVKPKQLWEERKPFEVDHDAEGRVVSLRRTAEVQDVTWIDEQKPGRVHLKLHGGTAMFTTLSETTLRRRWKLVRDVKR